ncbi:DNA-binding HxlR family transcriptional regulator [Actinoalloteichus hoggarensis]|uniref:Putative HTH-type transcriptional regulator YybR n=1 Tax=Actinoalloteichus hoggarensis TaxID=1470176 RepID=A0A221VZU0_9PSEU|nr:helix-turn-helix domain-containing protein [Actinoalloteichus hoggarensis]ASO18821.1 putative HTH-type transcriptional regulator YybR [Actinoalloteichus hoggarensis]MBB5920055.1 DNA-binding HxlR family transcriptional regulator [Actinoalloteichus hoggarensis]
MRQTSFAEMHCSLARSLDLVGDWWSPLILRDLYLGARRFDELVRDLGISRNLLTTRLATLMAAGVVERTPYQQRPVRHGYSLTEAGRDLVPILLALTAWGDRWAGLPDPPITFRHRTCGHDFVPTVSCSECDGAITAEDVDPLPGDGAHVGPGTRLVGDFLARRASPAE